MAWQQNQGSPIGGVVLNEYDAKATTLTNHLDKAALLPFAAISEFTDLGTRDIYALSHQEDVPFLLPNIKAGNVISVAGNEYTFNLPLFSEQDTTIVSVSTNDIYSGEPFDITVSNTRLGAYGSRFSPNLTQPYAFEVLDIDRVGATEQVKYKAIYRGNPKGEDKLPGDVLTVGRPLYKLGGTRSKEFGQNYDGWQVSAGPNRKFISRISDFELQTHYHMTYEACNFADGYMVKNKEWVLDNLNKVVDYIGIKNPLDPSIRTYKQYLEKGGNASAIGFKVLTTTYDRISIGILEKEIQNIMVWDPGGITGSDGMDSSYIHPGVWHQMEYSGYKHTFNPATASKEMLLSAIREYEAGKKIQPKVGEPREYRIRTGDGGLALIQRWFEKEFQQQVSGLIVSDRLGQYEGTYKTGLDIYTPWYKSVTVDLGRYKLSWELDPSLNPTRAYASDNPLIGGYRLSSYTMIIEDADFSSQNIKILRNSLINGGGMKMFVINGTSNHPLYEATNQGIPIHQAASLSSGFGAYFHARPDTAVVWDPTGMLRLTPINPHTGRPIY